MQARSLLPFEIHAHRGRITCLAYLRRGTVYCVRIELTPAITGPVYVVEAIGQDVTHASFRMQS